MRRKKQTKEEKEKDKETPRQQQQRVTRRNYKQWHATNRRFVRTTNKVVNTSGMEIEKENVITNNTFNALTEEETKDTNETESDVYSENTLEKETTKGRVNNAFYNPNNIQGEKKIVQDNESSKGSGIQTQTQSQKYSAEDAVHNKSLKPVKNNLGDKNQGTDDLNKAIMVHSNL